MLEYDPVGAPTKPTMLRYFREGLKPSVLAELKYWDLELESFDQMVKKAVNSEVKSALRSRSNTKEMDQNCPWDSQSANSTIAKSQSSTMKDFWMEKPKIQGIESVSHPPQRSNNNKFSDKAWKDKKKERCQKDWERREGSTPVTGANSTHTGEPPQKKKNQGRSDRASHVTSQIKCYNCQKMGHYANRCPKPKN